MLKLDKREHRFILVEKRGIFRNRAFLRYMAYSLLFHLSIFGLFQVKFVQFFGPEAPFRPCSLLLAAEEGKAEENCTGALQVATYSFEDKTLEEFPLTKISVDDKIISLLLSDFRPPIANLDKTLEIAQGLTLDMEEPYYPLKIHLAKSLKDLVIVEDGSSLFRPKDPLFSSSSLNFATSTYTINYSIKIDGKSGKIASASRKHELLDKDLQVCADKLIKEIRFAPCGEGIKRGKIKLIFLCSGDSIKGYLR
jgi:hypothetical protein